MTKSLVPESFSVSHHVPFAFVQTLYYYVLELVQTSWVLLHSRTYVHVCIKLFVLWNSIRSVSIKTILLIRYFEVLRKYTFVRSLNVRMSNVCIVYVFSIDVCVCLAIFLVFSFKEKQIYGRDRRMCVRCACVSMMWRLVCATASKRKFWNTIQWDLIVISSWRSLCRYDY